MKPQLDKCFGETKSLFEVEAIILKREDPYTTKWTFQDDDYLTGVVTAYEPSFYDFHRLLAKETLFRNSEIRVAYMNDKDVDYYQELIDDGYITAPSYEQKQNFKLELDCTKMGKLEASSKIYTFLKWKSNNMGYNLKSTDTAPSEEKKWTYMQYDHKNKMYPLEYVGVAGVFVSPGFMYNSSFSGGLIYLVGKNDNNYIKNGKLSYFNYTDWQYEKDLEVHLCQVGVQKQRYVKIT